MIAVAVAIATQGAGAGLLGALSQEAAQNAVLSAAADAGFSSLVSQASVSLINNGGDLSKVLQEMGSSSSLRNLAASVVTAGMTAEVMNIPGVRDLAPQGADLTSRVQRAAVQQGVGATTGMAGDVIAGKSPGASLQNRLIGAVVGTGAQVGANEIGQAYADGTLDPISHEVAHALLGCAVGAASGSCKAGAVSGALSEAVAQTLGSAIADGRPLSATEQQEILAAGEVAGILGASAFGGNAQAASAAAYNAVANNYLSTHQKAQEKKELEECQTETCKVQVIAKWVATSFGQDGGFAAGMAAGVPVELYDTVDGIAKTAGSPLETYEALKSLFNSDDVLGNVSDAVKKSYEDRINKLEVEYERAGASGSFNAGVEVGGCSQMLRGF